jgi:hypothetical protein
LLPQRCAGGGSSDGGAAAAAASAVAAVAATARATFPLSMDLLLHSKEDAAIRALIPFLYATSKFNQEKPSHPPQKTTELLLKLKRM